MLRYEPTGLDLDLDVTPDQWRERCAAVEAHETAQLPVARTVHRMRDRDAARAVGVGQRRTLDGVFLDHLLEEA